MNRHINHNTLFMLLTIVAVLVGLFFLGNINKGDESVWFNLHHNSVADIIFIAFTMCGEIYLILPAIVFVWFKEGKRAAGMLSIAMIIMGIAVQSLKLFVFEDMHRPLKLFGELHRLRIVDGIAPLYHHSFPSGHTATAFTLMFMLSATFKNKLLTVLFFIVALMTGISRMYLLQHFLADVIAGALLGVTIGWIINYYFAGRLKTT